MDFDQYVLGINFFKTLLRVTSQDAQWKWTPADPNAIWINAQNQSYRVMYTYAVDHRLEEIIPGHQQLFREIVLMYVKRQLGSVRGKYTIPLQEGGQLTIDGERLYNEAKEGLDKFRQELKRRMPPILTYPVWT